MPPPYLSLAVFLQIVLSKTINTYQQGGFACRRQGKISVAEWGKPWCKFVHLHRRLIKLASLASCSSNVGSSRGSGICSWRLWRSKFPRWLLWAVNIWRCSGGSAGFDGSEWGVAAKRECDLWTWNRTGFTHPNFALSVFSVHVRKCHILIHACTTFQRVCNKKLCKNKKQTFHVWHQATEIASNLVAHCQVLAATSENTFLMCPSNI